jgi:hypothetical protein
VSEVGGLDEPFDQARITGILEIEATLAGTTAVELVGRTEGAGDDRSVGGVDWTRFAVAVCGSLVGREGEAEEVAVA